MEFERVWRQHVLLSTSGLTKATPVCFQGILLVNFCLAMLDKAFALGMWMWKGLVSKLLMAHSRKRISFRLS